MPASRRVSPSERFRAQLDELFDSGRELGQVLEEVARLGVRFLFQVVLEAEVTEFLGRDRYARGERIHDGQRNGYAPVTVKTTAGPVPLERPKLRATDERFSSRLLGIGVTKTRALESLVLAGFVRGLSTRDVEATLEESLGEQAPLSKSTVSRICSILLAQFGVWQRRDLSDYELDYLFADASFFKYHAAAKGEPVLCTPRHHHRRQAGRPGVQRRRRRELRQLARPLHRPPRPEPPGAAAQDQRRQHRADLGLRAGLYPEPAPALHRALRRGLDYADVPRPGNSIGRLDLGIILAF